MRVVKIISNVSISSSMKGKPTKFVVPDTLDFSLQILFLKYTVLQATGYFQLKKQSNKPQSLLASVWQSAIHKAYKKQVAFIISNRDWKLQD